jgi:predicted phosphodiesterase
MDNNTNIMVMGDVHMDFRTMNKLLSRKKPDMVLQVGDFGYWPQSKPENIYRRNNPKYPKRLPVPRPPCPVYWIDGNHEDHDSLDGRTTDELWPGVFYMPRGSHMLLPDGRRVLFIGGAASHDKALRTPGRDWFEQEQITQRDLDNIDFNLKYDIVISHTMPTVFGLRELLGLDRQCDRRDSSENALDIVYEAIRPKLWYFGHWHACKTGYIEDTRWQLLDHSVGKNQWWMWLPKCE